MIFCSDQLLLTSDQIVIFVCVFVVLLKSSSLSARSALREAAADKHAKQIWRKGRKDEMNYIERIDPQLRGESRLRKT
jgi:hypothetical protein